MVRWGYTNLAKHAQTSDASRWRINIGMLIKGPFYLKSAQKHPKNQRFNHTSLLSRYNIVSQSTAIGRLLLCITWICYKGGLTFNFCSATLSETATLLSLAFSFLDSELTFLLETKIDVVFSFRILGGLLLSRSMVSERWLTS